MNLKSRSYQKELLDGEEIPFADIAQTMRELNTINTYLGGHAITLEGFKQLVKEKKEITVCEIGCGGGDNLVAIVKYCKAKLIKIHCIGIDYNTECIAFAKQNEYLKENTDFICSDYSKVHFENNPDIIFSSLFCHHFTDEELILQLQWMQLNAGLGFFINDLHRHGLAYFLIKLLTQVFSKSYLVKNDACLSVARGFKKMDWQKLFSKAGIIHYQMNWKWAFRYLIVNEHDPK
ncbi:MAG: methyltransferase domain-containing protein [Bacteroidetes bacterium]|nr:methyltransferase domain-containing protein [Bacteroidota bacterium]